MEILIELPMPSKDLSPNARVHWATKSRATKKCRQRSCLEALSLRHLLPDGPLREATIRRKFYFKDNRRRDSDNFSSMTKAYIDGLVDGKILIDDDRITYLPTLMLKDKLNPRLELIIYLE